MLYEHRLTQKLKLYHKIVIKISDNAEKDKLIMTDLVHPQQHEKIQSFCYFVWIVVWPFC